MNFDYSKEHKDCFFYPIGKNICRFLAPFIYRLKVEGAENIPESGALIIAGNHISSLDPCAVVAFSKRRIYYMAKSELFETPGWTLIMKSMNAFPVKRNYADRDSLKYALKILKKCGAVGIFPEGMRVKELMPTEAKGGVAYLARKSGADVLPVCLYRNPEDSRLRHSLVLKFGEVIKNSDLGFKGENRKEETLTAAEMIMNSIKKLWEEEHENSNR